ncbi:MAG: esterase/lipase family protein, partial [Polyangiaceae bacterium]
TYFPPTVPRARRRVVPLIVGGPILFRRERLYPSRGEGLVPYLQDEGFPVWLVGVDARVAPGARALGRGIAQTVTSIATQTGAREVDLLGLSMGAEGALRALDLMTSPGSPVVIRRVAFLGGGFDFAYPHSFGSRIAPLRGGPATPLCTLDGDVGCARDFRQASAAAAVAWLASIPAADDDALLPARERFPFVAQLAHLPVLFVSGKSDGIAPSESMFPLYTLWGSDEPDPRAIPKLLFLAGRENALGSDLDHFDLFVGPDAEKVWDRIVTWFERD